MVEAIIVLAETETHRQPNQRCRPIGYTAGEIDVIRKSSIRIGGTSAVPGCVVGLADVHRDRLAERGDVVEAARRAVVPPEVLHRPDDLAVLDQERAVARHAGVEQRRMLSTARMYQKNETSRPRRVDLIICSIV